MISMDFRKRELKLFIEYINRSIPQEIFYPPKNPPLIAQSMTCDICDHSIALEAKRPAEPKISACSPRNLSTIYEVFPTIYDFLLNA